MRSAWVFRGLARRWLGGSSVRKALRRSRRRPGGTASALLRVEVLEDRTVPSTVPAPVVSGQQFLDLTSRYAYAPTAANPFGPNVDPNPNATQHDWYSSPVVAADPINPQKLVAVATHYNDLNPASATTIVFYSTDGGTTWTEFTDLFNIRDPNLAGNANPNTYFESTTPSVAFGRSESFYIVRAEHDQGNTSSAVVLDRYDFSGSAPGFFGSAIRNKILYQAIGPDVATNTSVVVDTNLASFQDPDQPAGTAVQLDPFANTTGLAANDQLYVSWDVSYPPDNQDIDTVARGSSAIEVVASSNGGQTFTGQQFLSSDQNFSRDGAVALAVSQGTADGRIAGGVLQAVFSSTNLNNNNATDVHFNSASGGGAGLTFNGPTGHINDAISGGGNGAPDLPVTTRYTLNIPASAVPANFNISDLDLTVEIRHANMEQLSMDLVAPDGTRIRLFNAGQNALGQTIGQGFGLPAGANMGIGNVNDGGTFVGTTFDQQAYRTINARNNAAAPWIGHFRPEGSIVNDPGFLDSWNGQSFKTLENLANNPDAAGAGNWTLEITDDRNNGGPQNEPTQNLVSWSLHFSTGLTVQSSDTIVNDVPAAKGGASAPYVNVQPVSPAVGLGPAPSIAVDNTLGSFSPYQGRIYAAYVTQPSQVAPADNTDVALAYSDDGGATWTNVTVNQDNARTDGFSSADRDFGTDAGRAQFMPVVAVDPFTGAVLVQYADARWDAARVRYANYLDVSVDGGQTFSENFLNSPEQAIDTITGNTVTLQPIPNNPSNIGGGIAQTSFGFGEHQGLVVTAPGHTYSVWAGNLNFVDSDLIGAAATYAAGPRVVSSDMGPVIQDATVADDTSPTGQTTYDNVFAADGTRELTAFTVKFDRPVDVRTFTAADVQMFFHSPTTPAGLPGTPVAIASVKPLDSKTAYPGTDGIAAGTGQNLLATTFLVTLTTPQSGVGTYSYTVGPNVSDMIRQKSGAVTVRGNLMDQNANSTDGEALILPTATDPGILGDAYAAPAPLNGKPFLFPYDQNTLPISIPGPHVIDSFVPGYAPSPVTLPDGSTTKENLVLNGTANKIDIVFDRNMDPSTITTADLLRMFGPISGAGDLLHDANGNLLPGVQIIPDPNPAPLPGDSNPTDAYPRDINGNPNFVGADPDPAHPRTYQIIFPTQQLSGTYTVVLSPAVQAAGGNHEALDTNLNAGLDVLRDTASPGATNTASHTYNSAGASNNFVTIPAKGSVTSTIQVPDTFAIQALTLQLNLAYTNDPDLTATLIAPDGTKVQLFSGVGNVPDPNQRANFTNTTFDDNATTPIQKGVPPFNGTFNPQFPLSVLDGKPSAGTWKLVISNAGTKTGTFQTWSLTMAEATPSSGLGEAVADQYTASFRIYTQDPTNDLSHQVWTAVGGASNNSNTNSGRIGALAVDPSDPSGNTVYVGGASGGIWKTTNFLTTDPLGPTYEPLTDFGPTTAINIGGLAVFARNDPRQSIIFAATGEGDTQNPGVGILRSTDGGATWTLLDSLQNFTPTGAEIPEAFRDHTFVGNYSFKILVDPTPSPAGKVIVYVAFSGPNGGVYRSTDTGNTWQLMRAGQADDIVLNQDSIDPSTGNLSILYAAFQGDGVYYDSSAPTTNFWNTMPGGGGTPLILDGDQLTTPQLTATNNPSPNVYSGNGASGRIVLAAPFRTGDPLQDLLYKGWLYAGVMNANGHFDALYLTKDFGVNWVKMTFPTANNAGNNNTRGVDAIPSNNPNEPRDYDLGGAGLNSAQGNYDFSLAIDPTNPNITYVGGTHDSQSDGLIRVDATKVIDTHAFVAFSSDQADGGLPLNQTTGGINLKNPTGNRTFQWGLAFNPQVAGIHAVYDTNYYLNLLRDPQNPFVANSTLWTSEISGWSNDGSGATWTPFGNSFTDPSQSFLDGSTDHHRVISMVDPVTGHARIIFGDDQGVYTAVDDNGTVVSNIGTAATPTGSRNGDLQITQFYFGAAQPSILAAQVAQSMFYGQAQDDGFPHSGSTELTDGNVRWTGIAGDGGGIQTDQTGGGSIFDYRWPCCGNNGLGETSFLQFVSPGTDPDFGAIGRTNGLVQPGDNPPTDTGNWKDEGPVNFARNPVDPNGLVISSFGDAANTGRVFRTTDGGLNWFVIGQPGNLDNTHADALAFGAPVLGSGVALDDFIYAGTDGGHIFVTFTGGGSGQNNNWIPLSNGLKDNAPIRYIVASPVRGSHEAYAVSDTHVYFMPDSSAPGAQWQDITGNLFSITHVPQEGANFTEPQLHFLSSLAVDWRYSIPDVPGDPTSPTHPLLYVGGDGGIYRSGDQGQNWTIFPDNLPVTQLGPDGLPGDGAPVPGGYLPNGIVTDLQLSVGNVNPVTGVPDQSTGPDLLYATTYGRGSFVIRLPLVSSFNDATGPQIISGNAVNASNGALPAVINPSTGLDRVNLAFGGAVDPSTFSLADVNVTGVPVQSITRSGNVATVTTTNGSPLGSAYTVGSTVIISGANQPEYDGAHVITAVAADGKSFQFQVSGAPQTPATGSITMLNAHSVGVASITTQPTNLGVTGITGTAGGPATVSVPSTAGLVNGQLVTISGASDPAYNGTFAITLVDGTHFTYTPTATPVSLAPTGNIQGTALTALVTTAMPHGYTDGQAVTISGATPAAYDGTFHVTVTGATTFTYPLTSVPGAPASGTILAASPFTGLTDLTDIGVPVQVRSIERIGTTATVTTSGPHGFTSGETVAIAGAKEAGFNGQFVITVTGLDTFTYQVASSLPAAATGTISATLNTGAVPHNVVQIFGLGRTGNTVTAFTGTPHGFATGDTVTITGIQPAGYDGTFTVTVLDPFEFTYQVAPTLPPFAISVGGAFATLATGPTPHNLWQVGLVHQSAYGSYGVTVGPNLTDYSGRAMDQSGGTGGTPSFSTTFTIGSLQVVSATPPLPLAPASNGVSAFTITFNGSVDPSSFTTADITLVGPKGPVTPSGLQDISGTVNGAAPHSVWQVTVPTSQLPLGTYTLTVGPNISDAGDGQGNNEQAMDQDQDGPPFGQPSDAFTTTFEVSALAVKSVAPANTGALTTIKTFTVTFQGPAIDPTTFTAPDAVLKLPSGKTVTASADPVDVSSTVPGAAAGTVWQINFATQTAPGVYTLMIGPNISDQNGQGMDQDQDGPPTGNANDAFTAQFDIAGLQVKSATAAVTATSVAPPDLTPGGEVVPTGTSALLLTFNQAVGSFPAGAVTLTGPGGPVGIGTPVDVSSTVSGATAGTVWKVPLTTPLATGGPYTLTVGPGVTDLAGNAMNQNKNAVFGESTDAYSTTFTADSLSVKSISPTPSTSVTDLSSVTVTFNEAVDKATFAPTVTGPNGAVAVQVTDVTTGTPNLHNVWKISFADQTTPGTYTVTLPASVKDLGGNALTPLTATYTIPGASTGGGPTGGGGGTTTLTGQDVTSLVSMLIGGVRRKGNRFVQTLQFFNASNFNITGPFFLVVDGLPKGARLIGANGFTVTQAPFGHPYKMVIFSANQLNSLQGGVVTLQYTNPKGKKLRPTFRLLAGIPLP